MEQYNDVLQTITLAMGASWASGLNLYATLFILGFSAINGSFVLPAGLEILANPLVIGAAGLMYCVEFFADKIPGVDTSWDVLHTFVRIPAGALLAAGILGDMGAGAELAAAILGGSIAATTHAAKSGSRVLINTSPEPFSNWGASISEDIAVFAGLWAAINHPVWFLLAFIAFIVLMIWLLPKIWRGIKKVFGFFAKILGLKKTENVQHASLDEKEHQ
ncbi:MAG: DUF4126 domain-containing protein [Sulfurospirillum sp.]|nr:DUF4126 domain-containing protein [Sulfurospirillum sp.]